MGNKFISPETKDHNSLNETSETLTQEEKNQKREKSQQKSFSKNKEIQVEDLIFPNASGILSEDFILTICQFLPFQDALSLTMTSKQIHSLIFANENAWEQYCQLYLKLFKKPEKLEKTSWKEIFILSLASSIEGSQWGGAWAGPNDGYWIRKFDKKIGCNILSLESGLWWFDIGCSITTPFVYPACYVYFCLRENHRDYPLTVIFGNSSVESPRGFYDGLEVFVVRFGPFSPGSDNFHVGFKNIVNSYKESHSFAVGNCTVVISGLEQVYQNKNQLNVLQTCENYAIFNPSLGSKRK